MCVCVCVCVRVRVWLERQSLHWQSDVIGDSSVHQPTCVTQTQNWVDPVPPKERALGMAFPATPALWKDHLCHDAQRVACNRGQESGMVVNLQVDKSSESTEQQTACCAHEGGASCSADGLRLEGLRGSPGTGRASVYLDLQRIYFIQAVNGVDGALSQELMRGRPQSKQQLPPQRSPDRTAHRRK